MAAMLRAEEILDLIAQESNGVAPASLRDKYEIPVPSLGTMFRDLYKRGLLEELELPAGAAKNSAFYRISHKGRAYVEANRHSIRPVAQMVAEASTAMQAKTGKAPRANNAPAIPMNYKANNAMNSIAQLMQDYDNANQMLKVIYGMIGDYLKANQGEQSNEQQIP